MDEERKRQGNSKRKQQLQLRIALGMGGVILLLFLVFLTFLMINKVKSNGYTPPYQTASRLAETDGQGENAAASDSNAADAAASDAAVSETGEAIAAFAPEMEDGSGQAGLLPMPEFLLSKTAQQGWNSDELNAWYTPDLANCWCNGWQTIDGQTYHFDSSGLIDYGWKLIGGQGCYFDSNGVYQPTADPNKLLAFTFDDGPSQGMDELLALCEETGARVTFFMIGAQVEIGGAVIPHIIRDRCEVGNHSDTHTQMLKLSTEECVQNFRACDDKILAWTGGIESDVVRFPYGDHTPEEIASLGKPAVMWSVDSLDWDLLEAQPVIDTVLSQISEGDIILMHDRYESTVEACRYLFPYLISQGYQLVTVKELAAAKGYELEPGKSYYGFCQEYIEQNRVCE